MKWFSAFRFFAACGAGILASLTSIVAAQTIPAAAFPTGQVHIVVPYATGGQTDTGARLLAAKLTEHFGQRVIVENRSGGGGAVGTGYVIRSQPDGHTLLINTAATHLLPLLNPKIDYDPESDLLPVARLTAAPMLLVVRADSPLKDLDQLIEASRSKVLNYGSSGIGTTNHMAGEWLASLAQGNMVHIPYRGGAQVTQALLAGEIDFVFDTVVSTLPQIEAGKLRALGATANSDITGLKSIPVISEVKYPSFLLWTWGGLYAPKNTPPATISALADAFQKVLDQPDVAKRLGDIGSPVGFMATEDFRRFIREENIRYGSLIKQRGIRIAD